MSELANDQLYALLSLHITATQKDIKKAFDQIKSTYYISKRGKKTSTISKEKFEEIKAAYNILSSVSQKWYENLKKVC